MNALDEAKVIYEQLVTWRRDFHRHPEVGLTLPRSARIVAETLQKLGYTVSSGLAESGVVGLLENGAGPVVMVRADMDALPIQEENDVPYASEIPGKMHACGHDAHMAIGLGVAQLMAETRDHWQGTLKLVFQPGEEGDNGAEIMVQEGVLENPRPDSVLALHVWNEGRVGSVAVAPGPVMAAAEAWEAKIQGKGGHAAVPEEAVDPIVTAALTITALQTIVSRNVGAEDAAVVTVGKLRAGDTFNVIPDVAQLEGTVRTFEPEVRETVLRRLREIVEGTAETMGAEATLRLHALTPAVVNDEAVTAVVQDAVRTLLGEEGLDVELRTMGSEDAAFFLQEVPGCYFFVGATSPDAESHIPHHNPYFDIDEAVLPIGVAVLVEALRRLLPVEET
ncbi:MAG: M20 metallopeptidase family protein [Anaerolineae bacterium]